MENRRQYNPNTHDKPFNRNKFQKRPDDRYNKDRQFQPRDDRPRDDRPRDDRPRDDRFRQKDDRFQPREGRFQNRDNRDSSNQNRGFQKREGGFQRRDNKFGGKPSNKFEPKKRFEPKGKVAPPWKKVVVPKVYSEMQVTDGKHRGKFFQSTTSPKVRPTTRRIRETMFKIISRRVRGKRFLDLCAGSGSVGIEAISRGALLGTFVERSAKMCSFIKKNMATMEIKEGHGEIFEIEVVPFLKRMQKRRRFWDVVFLDPPYDTNYDEILEYVSRGVCIKPRGTFIIEHHAEMFFPEKLGVLKRWKVIVEGESALSFYERA
ncbi:MAG: 16S rRNA (guanine(966)-N(2))-methyltransferase RsmD [Pyrinomonadaceae bacterium]|nr:16S rRNA (guanine(966)-N(2))-methyltransferase RsmD [Pyrinomonadaceae bacterium]